MATPLGIYKPDGSTVANIEEIVSEVADTTDAAITAVVGGLMQVGRNSATTNSSGRVNIPHALGRVPVYSNANGLSSSTRMVVTGETDTNITVHVTSASTGADFVGNVTVRWLVA